MSFSARGQCLAGWRPLRGSPNPQTAHHGGLSERAPANPLTMRRLRFTEMLNGRLAAGLRVRRRHPPTGSTTRPGPGHHRVLGNVNFWSPLDHRSDQGPVPNA
jgi:hypothetical protein